MPSIVHVLTLFILGVFCVSTNAAENNSEEPIDIGSRRELFVDEYLIDHFEGKATQKLHSPVAREVAFFFDQPWEGNASGYPTVLKDGDRYKMWYRGHRYIVTDKKLEQAQSEVVCYAESSDGIHWTKPNLGLWPWNGSKENNIIWMGAPEAHNFAPFIDTNPECPADARYKAIGGTITSKGLLAFKSPDGIHWTKMADEPVFTKGVFDSHNTCFWDAGRGCYTMFFRYFSEAEFKGLRLIGTAYSPDMLTWTDPLEVKYPNSPPQQMYTNQIAPYIRAPHIFMGFPTRYVARPLTEHVKKLDPVPLRTLLTSVYERVGTDLTDGLFMASRDGVSFHRWDEAFLRPGPQKEGRWVYGDMYQSYGLFETSAETSGAPDELSMHFNEGSWRDEEHRLRRYTIRLDGFVSINAPYAGGEVITQPLIFDGKTLEVNYATSAAGSLKIELQDTNGIAYPGFALADADEQYGDSVAHSVTWQNQSDVSSLSGKPVRLRIVLSDGDLYSFRFVP
ncbi:MAG: hypothetical protein O2955_07820 [Planctomycetota bacterium]|nr:hypothetical protein [Planctomycetota bacterium]MDA1212408.1 hypothetical protein [Planctomycetota bacterium]